MVNLYKPHLFGRFLDLLGLLPAPLAPKEFVRLGHLGRLARRLRAGDAAEGLRQAQKRSSCGWAVVNGKRTKKLSWLWVKVFFLGYHTTCNLFERFFWVRHVNFLVGNVPKHRWLVQPVGLLVFYCLDPEP